MKISLYIHIPFCVQKCLYCDFLSGPYSDEVRISYIDALCNELSAKASQYKNYEVTSVFIGGGTPSVLSSEQIERIMECVVKEYNIDDDAEITIELNPGTIKSKDTFNIYKNAGINRLSIGLQSTEDVMLRKLGRIHTFDDFKKTYDMAVSSGFDNINLDLISGIPGQSVDSFRQSLNLITHLGSELKHLSVYSLIIEEGTRFYEMYGDGAPCEDELVTEDTDRQIYALTKKMLAGEGYNRYEISNYSKEGYESRHNLRYWTRGEYLGFGIGAASLTNNVRYKNATNINEYILTKGLAPYIEENKLSIVEQMEEFMYLGLRMTKGISIKSFEEEFNREFPSEYINIIKKYISSGHMERYDDRVMLTDEGMNVANYIMADFLN